MGLISGFGLGLVFLVFTSEHGFPWGLQMGLISGFGLGLVFLVLTFGRGFLLGIGVTV